MRMKKIECLSKAIYEPLKYLANEGSNDKDFENFARLVISVLEEGNEETDLERFMFIKGKYIQECLCRMINKSRE